MRIAIFAGDSIASGSLDDVVADARLVHEQGFAGFWAPQIFGYDAITVLALVGRAVPDLELGTAVVPTYPRHPAMLAAQALTAQQACGGRFTLGIGLSHQIVIESMFGYSFAHPARHMREYLEILMPLLDGKGVDVTGESVSAHLALGVPHAQPVPVVVAALGPTMLKLAGAHTAGTITWMTGPRTIGEHTAPVLHKAATDAGNPDPRIICGLPVCVTADADTARERAGRQFSMYGQLPSYRAMLDREGAAGPADVAIVGDEAAVRAGIQAVADAGATDFLAAEFGSVEERTRTRQLLQALL